MHQLTKAAWHCAAGGHIVSTMWQHYAVIEVPGAKVNIVDCLMLLKLTTMWWYYWSTLERQVFCCHHIYFY